MKYRVGGGGAVGGLVRVGEAVSRAPPELREWLDAKLEQVGVDPSPAYARYVLGLLLQPEGEGGEEEVGADEEEEPKGGGGEGRRRRRQGKRHGVSEAPIGYSWPGECQVTSQREAKVICSDFGKSRKRSRASSGRYHGVFGDGEFRKRTAAIDCLMSASDQKSGIEKLVDELCVKLKQIQNEAIDGSSFHFELSQVSENSNGNTTKCSAQDQAEKYYAAFPPLKKLEDKSANSSVTMSFDSTCAWNNRKVLSKCIGRNKRNEVWLSTEQMNETRDGENKENVKKVSGRVFGENSVWGMSGTGKETSNQIGLKENFCGKFTARHQRVPYSKARRDQNRFCKDYSNENEDGSNCKADPVRMVLMMALASSAKMWSGSSQRYSLGETEIEESLDFGDQHVRRRLYELKKNTWGGEGSMDEKFPIGGESDEESLATLFAKFDRRMEALWELEPEKELPPSFSLLANMPAGQSTEAMNPKASPNYSFILSGTNITSSIWSQCPISNNYAPHGSCSVNGKDVVPNSYNGSRVVGNELKRLAIKTGLVTPQLDNFRIIWEESTTLFPPQFIGVEKVVCEQSELLEMASPKEEGRVEEDAPRREREGILLSPLVCYHTVTKESLEALNHSSERSSFTEVTPRVNLKCSSCMTGGQVESKLHWSPATSRSSNQPCKLNSEEEEVEEDLLTSARTHFLPIRRLSMDSSSGLSESNSGGVHYEDGTTFSIQSTMEKVSFYRSESGSLILKEESDESENGLGKGICKTPKKYMVYKGAIGLKGRGCIADQDSSGFLPKFLVRQNEKSCQTDENDEQFTVSGGGNVANCCYPRVTTIEISVEEEEVEVSKGEECEFFFPGDAHLADDLDSMDQGEVEEHKMVSVVEWSQGPPADGSTSDGKHNDKEMSISLHDSWSKIPSVLCHCSTSSISVSTMANNTWEQRQCNGQCWNKIWKSSPDAPYCSFQEMDVIPISQITNSIAARGELELQSKLLRQELSEESDELFADLHMVRQMYLGMEWMAPDEDDIANDCDEEIEKGLPCDDTRSVIKRNLLAWSQVNDNLPEVPREENTIPTHEKSKAKKTPYTGYLDHDLMEEIFGPLGLEQVDSLLSTTIPPVAPKGMLFSFELEAEWKKNERNANTKACQNDHKRRRHSSGRGPRRDVMSQANQLQTAQRRRPCSFFVSDGSCHRSHCRFSHDLSSVPCRFWSDGSCLRGITCPFLHSSAPSVSSGSPSSPISPPPHRPRKQNYIPILSNCGSSLEDPSMRPITL